MVGIKKWFQKGFLIENEVTEGHGQKYGGGVNKFAKETYYKNKPMDKQVNYSARLWKHEYKNIDFKLQWIVYQLNNQ